MTQIDEVGVEKFHARARGANQARDAKPLRYWLHKTYSALDFARQHLLVKKKNG